MTTLLQQISADLAGKYDLVHSFAETVTGPDGELAAIFSNEYRESDAGGFVGAASSVPTLRCRDADALDKGDSVTVRGQEYQVVELQPNGYGETMMRLHLMRVVLLSLMFTSSPPPGGEEGVPYEHIFEAE